MGFPFLNFLLKGWVESRTGGKPLRVRDNLERGKTLSSSLQPS